jgi:hypothetical protein
MKTTILSLAVSFALLASGSADQMDDIVSYIRGEWLRSDLSVVTPDIREEVLARIREKAAGPSGRLNVNGRADCVLLLRLNDEPTMRELVSATRSGLTSDQGIPFNEELALSGQPALLPMIAEDFFRDDGIEVKMYVVDGDIGVTSRPFSLVMCRVGLEIVSRSDAFIEETRKWAQNLLQRTDANPKLAREVMRKWWRENEKAIGDRAYKLVRPGDNLEAPANTMVQPEPFEGHQLQDDLAPNIGKMEAVNAEIADKESSPLQNKQILIFALIACVALALVVRALVSKPRNS